MHAPAVGSCRAQKRPVSCFEKDATRIEKYLHGGPGSLGGFFELIASGFSFT